MPEKEKFRDSVDFSKIFSSSKISLFRQCPKYYHFNYISEVYSKMKNQLKKLPQNIFGFNTLGKAVHSAITLFYHKPEDQRSPEALKTLLASVWRSEAVWNKNPPLLEWGGFKTVEEEREAYRQALTQLSNFYEMYGKASEFYYLPTQDLKKSINDYKDLITPLAGGIFISGKFDLILKHGESLEVVDFKTGRDKDGEGNEFQLRFYKLLAQLKFAKPVTAASLVFLRSKVNRHFDLEGVSLDELKEEILKEITMILKTENFETRPGVLCRYCLFKTYCPDKKKVEGILKSSVPADEPDDLPF